MEKILSFDKIKCYDDMMQCLTVLCERYSDMSVTVLGHSIFNREIPMVSLGEGTKTVVYVGAMHGTDLISSIILLRFINEYCEVLKRGSKIYNIQLYHLVQNRKICIIPMMNPDGVEYVERGVDVENPFYDNICKLNKSDDFSGWRYNARGVDLTNNFLTPMEPETSSLAGFLRFNINIKLALELACGDNRIIYSPQNRMGFATGLPKFLSRVSSMVLSQKALQRSDVDLIDFCNQECGFPAYSILFGNQFQRERGVSDIFQTYSRLRELLFVTPTII